MRLLKFFWWSCVAVFCGLVLSFSGAFLYLSPGLPSVESLRSIQLQIPLRVYSTDGKLIAEFGDAVRVQVLRASLEDRKIDFRLVRDVPVRRVAPVEAPRKAAAAQREPRKGARQR